MIKKDNPSIFVSVAGIVLLASAGCQSMAQRAPEPVTQSESATEVYPVPPMWSTDVTHREPEPVVRTVPLPQVHVISYERPPGQCDEPYDLWVRLRNGFTLDDYDNPRVQRELAWFKKHQAYLDRVTERARPYLHLIIEMVEERDMPSEIALLPVVESAFQPFAYSHGRAAGLWQFIPGTGRRFGLKQNWWYDGRRDVAEATRAALDYLEYLHKEFDGDWDHALAAYNSGEGTVMRAIRKNRRKGKPTDYWSLDLPRETEGYVPKLLAISALVDNPAGHGVLFRSIVDEPFLSLVKVGSQIDMDLAAELAGTSLEDIYLYNPAFNRWATAPNGPHHLLVPIASAEQFKQNLSAYPASERIQWKRHRIREGESLGIIAQKYRTTVKLLKKVNKIRGSHIRAGKSLTIPVARKNLSRYRYTEEQRRARIRNIDRDGYHRVEYRVRSGDTFWEIARTYKVSIRALAKWNHMAPRDTLRPGMTLVIWVDKGDDENERTAAINPVNFVHPFKENSNRRISYTVRSGDSLALIAQRFRVTINNLKRWNKAQLEGKKYLHPGQRLTLYVDVRRQSGNV